MKTEEKETQNRGPVDDLWDKGFALPQWVGGSPGQNRTLSYVLLLVVLLLAMEWVGRKLLQRRAWVISQWVAQWQALHALRQRAEPGVVDLPVTSWTALVGGLEELVRDCLCTRGAEQLPLLAEPAVAFALALMESAGSKP